MIEPALVGEKQKMSSSDVVDSAFHTAYGRLPTVSEVQKMDALLPPDRSDMARILRRVVQMMDRASYPTSISGRFDPSDLVTIDLVDFRMIIDTGDWAVGRSVASGLYEPHLTSFMRENVKTGMSVVDVGANIGYFSMLAATCTGPTGHVLAFEPNSENCRLLLLSAQENHFTNIFLHPLALSDKRGSLYFSPAMGSNGQLLPDVATTLGDPNCIVVACDRLDDIAPGHVDFIKLDIEGAEYIALKGAEALLRRARPIVTSEFSLEMLSRVSLVDGRDFLNWMVGLDYRIVLLAKDGSRQTIGDIDDLMASWGDPCRIEDLAFLPS